MEDCIFCKIGRHEARSWMVAESEHACAIFDINPMGKWHTMVMPKRHYENIFDIPLEALNEVVAVLKYVTDLYHKKLGIDAVQIISNNGKAAQQSVFHAHWHIAPRHPNDGQNLLWKFYPELVDEFHDMLKELGVGKFTDAPIR
jgi:histidine triad (HIT) family protein